MGAASPKADSAATPAASAASSPAATSSTQEADRSSSNAIRGPVKQWLQADGGNGHYYQAIRSPKGIRWNEAQQYALLYGGYLATIQSEAENKFVFSVIDDPQYWRASGSGYQMGPWIGAFKSPDGKWQSINQEGPLTYTAWAAGQPDNSNKIQDRAHYYGWERNVRAPTWDDVEKTNIQRAFVIEYDSDPAKLPENPAAALNFTDPSVPPPAAATSAPAIAQ